MFDEWRRSSPKARRRRRHMGHRCADLRRQLPLLAPANPDDYRREHEEGSKEAEEQRDAYASATLPPRREEGSIQQVGQCLPRMARGDGAQESVRRACVDLIPRGSTRAGSEGSVPLREVTEKASAALLSWHPY